MMCHSGVRRLAILHFSICVSHLLVDLPTFALGFSTSHASTRLNPSPTTSPSDASTLVSHDAEVDYSSWTSQRKIAPWITFETAEKAARGMNISVQEFEYKYADVEAYTSCDDEGDGLHECDLIEDFFHPTKWLHLRSDIRAALGRIDTAAKTPPTEDEIWSQPSTLIALADTITKETTKWCERFILRSAEETRKAAGLKHTKESVRFKVVPASFGLEGVEDAIREASLELLLEDGCKSFTGTFIIAAPDTVGAYSDPARVVAAIRDENDYMCSDLVDLDSFLGFVSDLKRRLTDEARDYMEHHEEDWSHVPISDYTTMIPFHPHWNLHGDNEIKQEGNDDAHMPPYPTILVIRDSESLT
mmetsp:Transcript_36344/g.79534  ORF Transcript_36344/g.79534 Transcript_36344/m.79534 type:complete len:360 (+) Transcript_36344:70-1149(+)